MLPAAVKKRAVGAVLLSRLLRKARSPAAMPLPLGTPGPLNSPSMRVPLASFTILLETLKLYGVPAVNGAATYGRNQIRLLLSFSRTRPNTRTSSDVPKVLSAPAVYI